MYGQHNHPSESITKRIVEVVVLKELKNIVVAIIHNKILIEFEQMWETKLKSLLVDFYKKLTIVKAHLKLLDLLIKKTIKWSSYFKIR